MALSGCGFKGSRSGGRSRRSRRRDRGRRSEEYIASMVTAATIIVVMCGHLGNVQFSEKFAEVWESLSLSPSPALSL